MKDSDIKILKQLNAGYHLNDAELARAKELLHILAIELLSKERN
jgi:hypothetical protein